MNCVIVVIVVLIKVGEWCKIEYRRSIVHHDDLPLSPKERRERLKIVVE